MDDQSPFNSSEESVQVFVRIRPENEKSLKASTSSSSIRSIDLTRPDGTLSCVSIIDGNTVRLVQPEGYGSRKSVSAVDDKLYTFSKVFGENSNQEDIYDHVSSHVRATVNGYNSTIFAYGSTGSGKSYTMTGNSSDPGIIPRAISEIFSIIETTTSQENDVYFYVRLSYVELYNNSFRNLLDFASKELTSKENNELSQIDLNMSITSASGASTAGGSKRSSISIQRDKIEVRESQSAGVFLAGANIRIPVTSASEAFSLINRGNKFRAVGSTQCNDSSSRSHAILTLHVESRITPNSNSNSNNNNTHPAESTIPDLRLGKMHLVDLAGSERITLSGAEGDTLVETQNINLSLTALGDVLSALSKNAQIMSQQQLIKSGKATIKTVSPIVPVPYRNSKLTHLLKDSLGGNSKTIMVANIRQSAEYYQQTLVSLMYASRAKKIKNHSVVNRNIIGDTGIHAVSSEIERLRGRLDERSNEFERLRLVQLQDAKENNVLKLRLQELKSMNETEKKQLEQQMSHVIHSQAGQLASQRQKISSLQKALQDELAVSQNRIAEQEKEIKWLKKALDESSSEAKLPKEELDRMQKVLNGWQTQAQSTQRELEDAVKLVEELKSKNSHLSGELSSSKNVQQQLQDQLRDKSNQFSQLNDSYNSTKSQENAIANRCNNLEELNTQLREELARVNKELQKTLKALSQSEETLKTATEHLNRFKAETNLKVSNSHNEFNHKIETLEKEKQELNLKLKTVVSTLEVQMSTAINEVSQKLKDSETKRKMAEHEKIAHEKEIKTLNDKFAELQTQSEELFKQKDLEIQKLSLQAKSEKTIHENLASKILSLTQDHGSIQRELNSYQQLLNEKDVQITELSSLNQELISKHEEHVKKVDKETQKKMMEVVADRELELENIHKKNVMHVNNMKKEHALEIERIHSEYSIEILQAELREEISHLKNEISSLNKSHFHQLDENSKAIELLKSDHEYALKSLKTEYNSSIDKLKAVHLDNLSSLKIDIEQTYQSKMNMIVTELNEKHSMQLEEFQKQMEAEKDFFRQKEENFVKEFKELECNYNEELERLAVLMKHSEERADQKLAEVKLKYKEKFKETLIAQKNNLNSEKLEQFNQLKNNLDITLKLELEEALNHQKLKYISELNEQKLKTETEIQKSHEEHLKVILEAKEVEFKNTMKKEKELLTTELENKYKSQLLESNKAIESKKDEYIQTKSLKYLTLMHQRSSISRAFYLWKCNSIKLHMDLSLNSAMKDHTTSSLENAKRRVKAAIVRNFMCSQKDQIKWAFTSWKDHLYRSVKLEYSLSLKTMQDDHNLALRDKVLEKFKVIIRQKYFHTTRNSLISSFQTWKDFVCKSQYSASVKDMTETHKSEIKTHILSTVKHALSKYITITATENKFYAFSRWKDLYYLTSKNIREKQLQNLITNHDLVMKKSLQDKIKIIIARQFMTSVRDRVRKAFDFWKEYNHIISKEIAVKSVMEKQSYELMEEMKASLTLKTTQELDKLKVNHLDEINALVSENDSKLRSLQEKLISQQKLHTEEMTQALSDQLNQLLSSHKEELDVLRKERTVAIANHDKEISLLKEENKDKIESLKSHFDEKMTQLTLSSEDVISELNKKIMDKTIAFEEQKQNIATMKFQLEETKSELNLTLSSNEEKYKVETKRLKQVHEDEIKRIQGQLVTQQNEYETSIHDLKKQHEDKLEAFIVECNKRASNELSREVKQAEKRTAEMYNEKLDALVRSHDSSLQELTLKLSQQTAKKDIETEHLKSTISDLSSKLESLELTTREKQNEYENDLVTLKSLKERELSDLVLQSNQNVKELELSFEKAMQELQEKHRTEIDSLIESKKNHEEDVNANVLMSLNEAKKVEIESLNELHSSEMQQLKDTFSLELKSKLAEKDSFLKENMEAEKVKTQDLLDKFKKEEIERVNELQVSFETELDALIRDHNEQLKSLKTELIKTKTDEIQQLSLEHEAKVELITQENLKLVQNRETYYLSLIKQEQESLHEALRKIGELEFNSNSYKAELDLVSHRIQELNLSHDSEIKTLKIEQDKRIEAQKIRLDALKDEAIQQALLSQSEANSKSHNADLESLRTEMVDVSNRYKDLLTKADEKANNAENVNKILQNKINSLENERISEISNYEEKIRISLANKSEELSDLRLFYEAKINDLKGHHSSELECNLHSRDSTIQSLRSELRALQETQHADRLSSAQNETRLSEEHALQLSELRKQHEEILLQRETEFKINQLKVIASEKQRVEESFRNEFEELKLSLARAQGHQEGELASKLNAQTEEISALRANVSLLQEQNASLRQEVDLAKKDVTDNALRVQYDKLHSNYLQLLQQQADSLMDIMHNNKNGPIPSQLDDKEGKNAEAAKQALDYSIESNETTANIPREGGIMIPKSIEESPVGPVQWDISRLKQRTPSTPLHLFRSSAEPTFVDKLNNNNKRSERNNKEPLRPMPWSSPALRSSPTDQLIAAILDGDVQGIRAVVRSKGDDLGSAFWKDLAKSILPIHRAVSGLHFHGNEKLLVNSIECLIQLGADLSLVDSAGNTALHKAIQVCTSKCVLSVVETLITRGSLVRAKNKYGETPLHLECKRVRTASVQVIEMLVQAGAEVLDSTKSTFSKSVLTPLTLILLRGSDSGLLGVERSEAENLGNVAGSVSDSFDSSSNTLDEGLRNNSAGKRAWIPAAKALLASGAKWDPSIRTSKKETQLHLILSAFPPPVDQIKDFRFLVSSALENGLDPLVEDSTGKNCLFVFCETLGHASNEKYPESQGLLSMLLGKSGSRGVGNADHTGKTVYDIQESVPGSCLTACRRLLNSFVSQNSHQDILEKKYNNIVRADAKRSIKNNITKEKTENNEKTSIYSSSDSYQF